nr:hypothetical protein [uncultured Kingella sp.]
MVKNVGRARAAHALFPEGSLKTRVLRMTEISAPTFYKTANPADKVQQYCSTEALS